MRTPLLFLFLCYAPFVARAEPAACFPTTKDTEFTLNGWYLKHLKAMGEVSMHQRLAQPIDEFRFLYLPTFNHPISVRVTKSGEMVSLRAVMLSGKGGYEPGCISAERKRVLTAKEWRHFQSLLSRASFWQGEFPDYPGGMDGSQWIFEGSGTYRYRLLDIWTPTADTRKRGLGAFIACGKYLIRLSGLKPDEPLY